MTHPLKFFLFTQSFNTHRSTKPFSPNRSRPFPKLISSLPISKSIQSIQMFSHHHHGSRPFPFIPVQINIIPSASYLSFLSKYNPSLPQIYPAPSHVQIYPVRNSNMSLPQIDPVSSLSVQSSLIPSPSFLSKSISSLHACSNKFRHHLKRM